ncbi:ATP-binding cassette G family transporter ABCG77 [Besnoitia besnoiti]|uniref:ATP-binding cassette G family transporter ABCG77 n=1 Tax=Besnoitia besnoiti TaxID=94643 RepID=A0A2A9M6W0_BESBE|nr:ATP-binding cassette G family transporter ABCG77 [Besnoitia besnoiti]PFH33689.1 ATP-binding cassette G family transporter ABCG77 [Besnoitia besnoiti]
MNDLCTLCVHIKGHAGLQATAQAYNVASCAVDTSSASQTSTILLPNDLHGTAKKNGLTKSVSGLIEVNRAPASGRMKKIVGYVMQQEHFFANSTVQETVIYTARLRVGGRISFEEKKARVKEVVQGDSCRKRLLSGLSGGELERLNIANQLFHRSPFLLDEPTSGLDASISAALLGMLKQPTRSRRCTTVCNIHQPKSDVFMGFDRVVFLKDGLMV